MPGERTPRKVPMMPEADIVALSTSVSNQRSRKSTALIVMSCTWLYLSSGERRWKRRPRKSKSISPFGLREVGSGGVIPMIGLTKRPISTIARPYSS